LNPKKIVIAGGPGTGKTTLINHLKIRGFLCYNEISRQVTLEARKAGIEQLFLTEPLLFSKKLPWQDIFKSDNERYENFDEAIQIHKHLLDTYKRFGYQLIDVPFGSVKYRADFVLESLNLL